VDGDGATDEPLSVTVVIPAYNRERTIARAVRSALDQRPRPREIIVVDDGSDDGTADAGEAAGARVIRLETNRGVSTARNVGLEAAGTEWVAFLDSDDEWVPGHLDRLRAWTDGRVLVADALRSSSGRLYGNPLGRPLELHSPADLFPITPVATSGTMVRRDVAVAAGGFPPIPLAEDLDLWCRLLELGAGVSLPEVGGRYHTHTEQASRAGAEMRKAVGALMDRYGDRPWMTAQLRNEVAAVHAWDDFRSALRAQRRRDAVEAGARLASIGRLRALPGLWRWRAAERATPVLETPGEATATPDPEAEVRAWRADRARFGGRAWMREQAIWAVALYRLGRWNDLRPAGLTRFVIDRAYWLAYRPIETLTGISLDKGVACGPGLRIHHFGGITVHSGSVIGANCTLRQGVTIGERVAGGPVPVIEDDVDIGVHASILGGVRIGRGARIGAMALVLQDVPPGGRALAPRAQIEPPGDGPRP
jgi:serine O-acetyltransferase